MVDNQRSNDQNVNDILEINQDHVPFDGERLVINHTVRDTLDNVLQEHVERYKFACNYVQGKKVLDVASGAGYGSKMLSVSGAKSVVGVDVSLESVHAARGTYSGENIEFLQGDACNLVFDDETFDVVVSFETIEHIKSGSVLVEQTARVLKENGLLIVSTPNRNITNPGLYSFEQPLNRYHQFEYNIVELLGDLLVKYDLVGLYGQTISSNPANYFFQIVRNSRQLVNNTAGSFIGDCGYSLIPFHKLINAEPMYVVAVCRKKQTSS